MHSFEAHEVQRISDNHTIRVPPLELDETYELCVANASEVGTSYSAELWAELNATQRTAYTSRSPAALLGACNATCADAAWAPWGGGPGPVCGVPGCG